MNDKHPMPVVRPRMRGRARGRGSVRTTFRSSRNTNSRILTGSDLILTTMAITTKTIVGTLLSMIEINPLTFEGTRLHDEVNLWSRWRPKKLSFEIRSSAGNMTSGSYAVGFTYDTVQNFQTGPHLINVVSALRPSHNANIHTGCTFNVPTNTTQKWYSLRSREKADSTHGRVLLVITSPLGSITADSRVNFTIRLNWTVELDGISFPPSEASNYIYCDTGFEGYHTTSTSDWAGGTKLSVKHTAGGALVPFSTAESGTIYMIEKSAKLDYVKTADGNTYGTISYGVVIRDFPGRHLAVFETLVQAQKYLASGNSDDATVYYGAGNAVSPDNPPWKAVDSSTLKTFELEERVEELTRQLAALGCPVSSPASVSSEFVEDFHL